MISRSRYFFIPAVFVLLSNFIFAQKLLKPDTAINTSAFPDITGSIWYRGFGNDSLRKDMLIVKEGNKVIGVEIKRKENSSLVHKNKRVILLVENHFKPKGIEEMAFFSQIIINGISGAINPGDEVMVCTFDWARNGQYVFNQLPSFTDNVGSITDAIKNITRPSDLRQVEVTADINHSLMDAIKMLSSKNGNMPSAIFLFSDDLDRTSDPITPLDVKIEALKNNIPIYGISYSGHNRYHEITSDQICLPSYGRYFISPSNNVDSCTSMFSQFLNGFINDSRGSSYSFSYKTDLEKGSPVSSLSFELNKSGMAPETVSLVVPKRNLMEWIMANLVLVIVSFIAFVLVIVVLIMLSKNAKKNKLLQEEAIKKTRLEMEEQKTIAGQAKVEMEMKMDSIRKQQAEKEKEIMLVSAAEKKNKEEERLIGLMLMTGNFPRLDYSFQGNSGSVDVNVPVFSIGREKTNNFYISLDAISRKHASIIYVENVGYKIIDHDSSNGTFVNGENIKEEILHSGDCIQIGGIDITFHL